jgi:hypothetical protein
MIQPTSYNPYASVATGAGTPAKAEKQTQSSATPTPKQDSVSFGQQASQVVTYGPQNAEKNVSPSTYAFSDVQKISDIYNAKDYSGMSDEDALNAQIRDYGKLAVLWRAQAAKLSKSDGDAYFKKMYNDFKDNHELFNNKVEPFDRLGEGQPKIKSYLTVTDPITGATSEVEHINVPIADRLVQHVAQEDKRRADVVSVRESDSFQQALKDIAIGNNVRYTKGGFYEYIGIDEKTGQYYMISGRQGSDEAQIYISNDGGKTFGSTNPLSMPETGLSGMVVPCIIRSVS